VVHYINSYGQDKVIFGTDFPVLRFQRTIGEIDALGLKPQVRRKFLRDNVRRVYGLEERLP
jgi:predicted TIM-barrel fold metal-dependent hydrolase